MKNFTPEILEWYYIVGGNIISYSVKNLWPSRYLSYAKKDLAKASERSCVNCVSNAKRALHYQVDALAVAFGWDKIKKKRNDFPSKMEFLGKCGVISPTIIRRINKMRNRVEHDYYIPSEDEAVEYLEIVELYLLATDKTSSYFPDGPCADLISDDDEYESEWNYPESLEISIPEAEGVVKIKANGIELVNYNIDQPEYFEWVSAVVRQHSA